MRRLILLLAVLTGISAIQAADVEVEGQEDLSRCRIYTWEKSEKIPIFHPLLSPTEGRERSALEEGDRRVRRKVEEVLADRGWRKQEQNVDCLLTYSLMQELDLDISRMEDGGMAPRRNDGYGGGIAGGANASLLLRGTFTLNVHTAGNNERIWRGTLSDAIGESREWLEKSTDFAEEVAEEVPRIH